MAFWNKNKKEIPDELPDLISDSIEKNSQEVNNYLKENERSQEDEIKSVDIIPDGPMKRQVKQNFVEPKVAVERSSDPRPVPKSSKEIVSRLIRNIQDDESKKEIEYKKETPKIIDKSFFNELQNNITNDNVDLNKLEDLQRDISKRDILSDMKSYWEKEKNQSALEIMGKNFQDKIALKIEKLQELEKDWQVSYFELIEKEDLIKQQEADLKETLKEFVELCKNKKSNLEVAKIVEGKELKKNEERKR